MENLCREIAYVNKPVSRIFFGTASKPFMTGQNQNDLLDAVFAMGINAFDTARVYELAENVLGAWLNGKDREKVVLLSKCAHPEKDGTKRVNETEIKKDLKESLSRLGTDYLDIYLLHRDDEDVSAGEIVEIMNELHAAGKIRAFGGSNWKYARIEAACEYAYAHNLIPFSVTSPHFGLADQMADPWGGGCVSISGPSGEASRNWYEKNKMPVIAYSSLGNGFLSGRLKSGEPEKIQEVLDEFGVRGYGYKENFERLRRCEILAEEKGVKVPQIAMAWIYSQPLNTFAVVSTSSPSRMQENIDALRIHLTEAECLYLDLKAEKY